MVSTCSNEVHTDRCQGWLRHKAILHSLKMSAEHGSLLHLSVADRLESRTHGGGFGHEAVAAAAAAEMATLKRADIPAATRN